MRVFTIDSQLHIQIHIALIVPLSSKRDRLSFSAKMLFDREINIKKTTIFYHRCLDLILGFAMSLGFKPTDIWSSSYGRFSEHLSKRKLGDVCTCKDGVGNACKSHINIKLRAYTCRSFHGLCYKSWVQAN